uniref:Putative transposase, Ptta/En/Spm, plant n=2 Tax=Helianthus annuus TaxID=4232 RepID=A0A251SXL4_HELAN
MTGRGRVPSPGDVSKGGRGRVPSPRDVSSGGCGRVPSPGDVSSGVHGRGRGHASVPSGGRGLESGGGRGRGSESGGGRGRGSESGGGRGRASEFGGGRGRASESGGEHGKALDSSGGHQRGSESGAGCGWASDSNVGGVRASGASHGHGRGKVLELSPGFSRTLGRGYAGSSSRTGNADPMADMQGALRRQLRAFRRQNEDIHHEGYEGSEHGFNTVRDHAESDDGGDYHEDTNETQLASNAQNAPHAAAPHDHPQRQFIFRVGKRFANGKVHRAIRTLFNECFDGAWATYREVPTELVDRMFDRFRTRFNWDQANDEAIREGFENVLKRRFADIMSDYRKESAKKARVAGYDFPDDRLDFEAMRKFPPRFVHLDVWDELCMGWNTEAWRKKSEKGRNNRKKVDNDDVISRHTGGSRGYDEHRIILERALGRPPTFRELFLATHLTKESKKDFWDGLFDESLEGDEFCTARSRLAYEAYDRSMVEKYGEDVLLHPVGDADLWERAQGRSGFGIGSSDPRFIVNGTPSSSSGSASYADFQRSQEQVQNLQSQVDMLHSRVEEAQQQVREEMREEMQRLPSY